VAGTVGGMYSPHMRYEIDDLAHVGIYYFVLSGGRRGVELLLGFIG
jgi:hypothetical protein